MARERGPVTDEEFAEFREKAEAQREEVRQALANDLGGDPEDYSAEAYLNDRSGEPVADGGDGVDTDEE